jgi:hypothetical protein
MMCCNEAGPYDYHSNLWLRQLDHINYWHFEATEYDPERYIEHGSRVGMGLLVLWAMRSPYDWEAIFRLRLLDFDEQQAWEYMLIGLIDPPDPTPFDHDDDHWEPEEGTFAYAYTAALNYARDAYVPSFLRAPEVVEGPWASPRLYAVPGGEA